ncbi:MAG: helix-turn-helix transcriptional regulator [Flavobacteriales bacterium]
MKLNSDIPFILPTHDLQSRARPVTIEKLAYTNSYDFTKKHRHKYFEILFFEKGGGTQLIDFKEYEVKDNSCYIVMPNQVHLLNRGAESKGFLMQFYHESLSSNILSSFLFTKGWYEWSGLVFENEPEKLTHFKNLSDYLSGSKGSNHFNFEKDRHLIQALLFDLFSNDAVTNDVDGTKRVVHSFLGSVENRFATHPKVQFHIEALGISEKKLNASVKKHLGLTPLKVIHSRIMLEAKRLLVFADKTQKEIAYELGFDSPSSFSAFIKSKTKMTISELQEHLVGIHNR